MIMAGKRGRTTPEPVIIEAIRLKKIHPEMIIKEIRKELLKKFKPSTVPKVRGLSNILNKNLDRTHHSFLDDPWSLGASMKNNISSEADLIVVKALKKNEGLVLTIREVLWLSKLYPLLVEKLTNAHPGNDETQINELIGIAQVYAYQEQLNEVRDDKTNNTTNLDKKVLFGKELSDYYHFVQ
jgi:hypothetical protein